MKKPPCNIVLDGPTYWAMIEANGFPYPEWVFDFVSIHQNDPLPTKFRLISPLILVNEKTGARPLWEQIEFPSHEEAAKYAKQISIEHDLFVLNCPLTNQQEV